MDRVCAVRRVSRRHVRRDVQLCVKELLVECVTPLSILPSQYKSVVGWW